MNFRKLAEDGYGHLAKPYMILEYLYNCKDYKDKINGIHENCFGGIHDHQSQTAAQIKKLKSEGFIVLEEKFKRYYTLTEYALSVIGREDRATDLQRQVYQMKKAMSETEDKMETLKQRLFTIHNQTASKQIKCIDEILRIKDE